MGRGLTERGCCRWNKRESRVHAGRGWKSGTRRRTKGWKGQGCCGQRAVSVARRLSPRPVDRAPLHRKSISRCTPWDHREIASIQRLATRDVRHRCDRDQCAFGWCLRFQQFDQKFLFYRKYFIRMEKRAVVNPSWYSGLSWLGDTWVPATTCARQPSVLSVK